MTSQKATDRRQRHRRRRILFAAGSIIALLALVILVDSALYYGKVHAGVSIAGRSVGGLTRDETTALLNRMAQDEAGSAITLSSGPKTWTVTPADVSIQIDVAKAVSAAMDVSRKSNFLVDLGRRLALYFSHEDIPLQGKVDETKMGQIIAQLARDLEIPPVDAGLRIAGSDITTVRGQKGLIVDRGTLRDELVALLLAFRPAELAVPMIVAEPRVVADDYQQALLQARTMISSEVVLESGDRSWTLSPEQIAAYMGFYAEDREGIATLVPVLSAEKMDPLLTEIAAVVDKAPLDASFLSNGEVAWVEPAVTGRELDRAQTATSLTTAALKTNSRTATVVLFIIEPELTTEEAEAMGIKDRLAGFTTKWEGTKDRQTNVRITTEYANNVILAPGEIYDFDKQIGPRTEARGYKLAPGIIKGALEDQLGGGICQVSTTLFNAAFFAGLEIVERKNHSIYIDHYPKGRDATVSAGGPNMRFRNDTAHHILIRGYSNGITTTFNIYGTDDGRKVTYSTSEFYDKVSMATYEIKASWLGPGTTFVKITGQPGKSIKVVRKVTAKDGTVLHNDTFTSVWKMITREVEVGTGSTTTTAPPSTTTGT